MNRILHTLLLFAILCLVGASPTGVHEAPPALEKKVVAVLYFDNNSGEEAYDYLGKGLADMLITDLSSVDALQLVERERLEDLIEEMKLQQSAYFDSTTALEMGRFVGAEYVVTGALTALSPQLRMDTRVIQVETSRVVKTASVEGEEDKFFDLYQDLTDELLDGLALALSPEERERLEAQQEANRLDEMETALAYAEALDRYDREDYVGAAEKMHYVTQRAPNSMLVQLTYEMMEEAAIDSGKKKLNRRVRSLLRKRKG